MIIYSLIIIFIHKGSYHIHKSHSFGQNIQITHQNISSTSKTNIKKKTMVLKSILIKNHFQISKF